MKKPMYLIIVNSCLILLDLILLILSIATKNSKFFFALGTSTGITFVLILLCIFSFIIWKNKKVIIQFDERQLKNRGDCFSISFFVLIGCLVFDGLLRLLGYEWSNYFVGIFTWIMISIGIFAILAIWKDAYASAGENKVKLVIFLLVIGILDFTLGLTRGILEGFIIDNQMDLPFINVLSGVIIVIIAINLLIKAKLEGKENFEDEEFETEVC